MVYKIRIVYSQPILHNCCADTKEESIKALSYLFGCTLLSYNWQDYEIVARLALVFFILATGFYCYWLYITLTIYLEYKIDTGKHLRRQTKNPIVKYMIKIWYDVKSYLKESHSLSQYSPILGNQFFVPGRADATFKLQASKGLDNIQNRYMWDSDIIMSFFPPNFYFNILIILKNIS